MFNALDEKDLNIVIDAMDAKHVKADETVIKEGEPGEVLYIVESGTLKCFKFLNNTDTFLKNYEHGEVFGELALLYNAPRAATIISDCDSELW